MVGLWNGCIVTRGDLVTVRLQLAPASRYCFENGWGYPLVWYSSENSSSQGCGNVTETTSTMATGLHFESLNHSYSILIFKCILFFNGESFWTVCDKQARRQATLINIKFKPEWLLYTSICENFFYHTWKSRVTL